MTITLKLQIIICDLDIGNIIRRFFIFIYVNSFFTKLKLM